MALNNVATDVAKMMVAVGWVRVAGQCVQMFDCVGILQTLKIFHCVDFLSKQIRLILRDYANLSGSLRDRLQRWSVATGDGRDAAQGRDKR